MFWNVALSLALSGHAAWGAEKPRQQAFGPIKFGMTQLEANNARFKLVNAKEPVTAATVRKMFITNDTKYVSKLAFKDNAARVSFGTLQNPETKLIGTLRVQMEDTGNQPWEEARESWLLFKDIGEAKFGKMQEERDYPSLAECMADPKRRIVTGYWEYQDLRIELYVGVAFGKEGPTGRLRTYPRLSAGPQTGFIP